MKKLIVISIDALGAIDEEVYSNMPFLRNMIRKGAWIKNLKTIYPTVTYPIHTTMITGVSPIVHGIANNLILEPNKLAMDWYWDEKYIKCDTIFKAAKRSKLKCASFSWPVTCNANIDYNFPEIGNTFGMEFADYIKTQTKGRFIDELIDKFGRVFPEEEPEYDEFLIDAAIYTFNKYKPDITFIHLIDIDNKKHIYGSKHLGVDYAIKQMDNRIERFFNEIAKEEKTDDLNVIILSDHSQIDTFKSININNILRDMNLLKENKDGSVSDYKAFFLTNGGSAALYLKKYDEKIIKDIREKLEELEIFEIEKILNREEIVELGASKDAQLFLEAREGYIFNSQIKEDLISKEKTRNHGNHGYLPNRKNYDVFAIFTGPDFKENVEIEQENILNIAPTIEKILGLKLMTENKNYISKVLK